MTNDVDDIFKSFVDNKLKQFGMNGLPNAAESLEESMKRAMDAKVGLKSDKNINTYEETDKEKKEKKAKKKKKHKEEKSKKKKRKREKEENSDDQSKMEIEPKKLKKSLLVNENDQEGEIEKKTVTCYHETVTKLKEIEKLSIGEKKNNGNLSKTENSVKQEEKNVLLNSSVMPGANQCVKTVQKGTDLKVNDQKVGDSYEKNENGIRISKPEILSPVPAVKSDSNTSETQKTAVNCPVEKLQEITAAKSSSAQELKTTIKIHDSNNVSEAKVGKNNQKTDLKGEISSQKNEDSNKGGTAEENGHAQDQDLENTEEDHIQDQGQGLQDTEDTTIDIDIIDQDQEINTETVHHQDIEEKKNRPKYLKKTKSNCLKLQKQTY
uniref:DNA ligase 1-like isoform X1 n=1 Tax=Ciona intestinalis TaxID=7719 RepID=UPI000180BF40|nr:DNA ligase 1-like isoform X1 [Ciona intestinalis]|eukprot:XP_002126183.1 DNA ligase 1-like isoform X1 [Ciona intestinalis]